MIDDFETRGGEEGEELAGSYIQNYVKAVNRWLDFNDITPPRKVAAEGADESVLYDSCILLPWDAEVSRSRYLDGCSQALGGFSMDAEAFAQAMLKTDSSIRYVAVVSDDYRILASKQREGVAQLASDEAQRNFVSIIPQIIIESVDKLAPFLGRIGGVTVHYDKALLVLYRFENLIVVVTFEAEVATPFYNRITEEFKKHSAQYLS